MSEPSGLAQDLRYTKTLLSARSQSRVLSLKCVGEDPKSTELTLYKEINPIKDEWVKTSPRITAFENFWFLRSKHPRSADQ